MKICQILSPLCEHQQSFMNIYIYNMRTFFVDRIAVMLMVLGMRYEVAIELSGKIIPVILLPLGWVLLQLWSNAFLFLPPQWNFVKVCFLVRCHKS